MREVVCGSVIVATIAARCTLLTYVTSDFLHSPAVRSYTIVNGEYFAKMVTSRIDRCEKKPSLCVIGPSTVKVTESRFRSLDSELFF